jgi:hypothetical protein
VGNFSNNLLDLFNSLRPPEQQLVAVQFTAHEIPERRADFIAKDRYGQPALLIAVPSSMTSTPPPQISLEHLVVDHGLECKVKKLDGIIHQGIFSVIRCVNADRFLHEYFLRSIIPIVQKLPFLPEYRDISHAVISLVELFRQLNMPSRKSVQGLWAELFLITSARFPQVLIETWHRTPEDLYDTVTFFFF